MASLQGKTVLVTGASGFLGRHLIRLLRELSVDVVAISRRGRPSGCGDIEEDDGIRWISGDLVNFDELETIPPIGQPIDAIIHSAALDGNAEFKRDHPAEIVNVNSKLTSNILELARVRGIQDVVLVSSAEIYSSNATSPIREQDDFTSRYPTPANGYILSKIIMEVMGYVYAEQYKLRVYIPRLTNMYGAGEDVSTDRIRVIPSMVTKVINDQEVYIWGDGQQSRSFIHVEDAARCILLMMEKEIIGPLNIATKQEVKVVELAEIIFKLIGVPRRINFIESMPTGPSNRILDVGKLYQILNFEPRSIQHGLEETVAWYRAKHG